EVLIRIDEEFLKINKVAMGKPRLIREYHRRINDMRGRGEECGRILRLLKEFMRSIELWVDDGIEHNFDCVGEIPRKDVHLFVTAKEAALMEGAKKGVVVSSDDGVVEVKECENGRAQVRVIPVDEFQGAFRNETPPP
ncbi:MAG: hypothetical protein ACXQTK_02770, partial [Candidatus Syntropharchaeales archaeon]